MQGPDYTVDDLVYYLALMGGVIVAYFLLGPFEVNQFLRGLLALFAGVGVAMVATQAYDRMKNKD